MAFTNEQIEKALKCKSVDELLELAKNEGVTLSKEDATKFMEQVSSLSPDDLDMVSGGRLHSHSKFLKKRINDK